MIQDDEVSAATCDGDCGSKCLIFASICLFYPRYIDSGH